MITRRTLFPCIVAGLTLAIVSSAGAAERKPVKTSVYSRVDPSYKRKQNKDGTPERQFYAISNGGLLAGTRKDEGMDKVDFPTIAGVVADQLARQNYYLAHDAKSADILLAVYWGRTIPFNETNYSTQVNVAGTAVTRAQSAIRAEQQATTANASSQEELDQNRAVANAAIQEKGLAMAALESEMIAMNAENGSRDQVNAANASLLGYIDDMNDSDNISRSAGSQNFNDLKSDIEESRYYIVVMAYDFKRLVEKKERKLYWLTRISISVQGNKFQERLDEMIARAGRYFGRNSRGLVREYEGTVEYGEAEVIGYTEPDGSPPKKEKTKNKREKQEKPAP